MGQTYAVCKRICCTPNEASLSPTPARVLQIERLKHRIRNSNPPIEPIASPKRRLSSSASPVSPVLSSHAFVERKRIDYHEATFKA